MSKSNGILKELDKKLLSKLEKRTEFNFKLQFNRKTLIRNGLLLTFLAMLLGGGLGAIIDLIYLYTGITNEYAVLGIGSGVGAIVGLILGGLLLIALKSRFVDDYGSGYGLGIGTNIYIGAVIGLLFGAAIGSLFGLVLKAVEFTTGSTLSYPVFGMLIWITLGLNIGALIGLLASFGLIEIIVGGIITGVLVGAIGMFAIFGIDILVLYGTIAGLVSGGLIGLLVKYSINASIGQATYFNFRSFQPKENATLITQSQSQYCCSSGNCGGCYVSDCGSCSGGGETCAVIGIFAVVFIPIIILIAVLSWTSKKASVKFGGIVKRGALTALGASFSIFLIIGSNIGLTESYHNMLFEHNVLIGAGIGLVFGLLVFLALRLSTKRNAIKITPYKITWKDRHSFGTVSFEDIEDFEFVREQRSTGTPIRSFEDYFKLKNDYGETAKVVINCWDTSEKTYSTDYLESILTYYINRIQLQKLQLKQYKEALSDDEEDEELSGNSVSETEQITNEMVAIVEALLDVPRDVSIDWLCSVTQYSGQIVAEIITNKLGFQIQEGRVVK